MLCFEKLAFSLHNKKNKVYGNFKKQHSALSPPLRCLRGSGAFLASHQSSCHQIIEKSKLCDSDRDPRRGPGGGQGTALSMLHAYAERRLFVWSALMKRSPVFCLWSSQAWGQVADRRSLCAALCPLPKRHREAAVALFHGYKNRRDTKTSQASSPARRLRGQVSFFPRRLTLIRMAQKMFTVEKFNGVV